MATVDGPAASRRSLWARLLVVAGVLTIFGCCVVPGVACRPAVDVNTFHVDNGMTQDEVRVRYGPPSSIYPGRYGVPNWHYYTDRFGLGFTFVGVEFDAAGRVTGVWND